MTDHPPPDFTWWQCRRLDLTCLLLDLGFPRLAYLADPTTSSRREASR